MLSRLFGEDLFDEMFEDPFEMMPVFSHHNPLYGKHARALMKTDVREKDNAYELDIDLPGFKKEEIRLDLNGDTLTISAKHENTTEEKGDNGYLRRERRYGAFARSFDVSGIKTEGITASYENGVLTLELPKAVPTRPVSRQIELK